ncbi:P-loop containing nucleoside triphosphate hydrolase protein [Emericellopsis atlantica]|uniref:P-loop containing nucleoside triphosphate hydrolase protein n=1 Tax=Emericellopsis atlantica TaxID=2614577 RepID=A0A9P7ZVM3_9HYPO|nr:P-loop containing nucleoside triphosphate hydrolase protein [Emericellopsis atlantica]KAG9259075.1 P-loop containing nucleoside triphosphate hydrolase protein [Emericellopsis atlantica]
MTSMDSESATTILCTSKQTRFDIQSPNYRELDVEGLQITIAAAKPADGKATKSRGKAKTDGLEILTNAKLRLKEGQRYALVGRNGTGKSTLLKAIAEKLIPGIPEETRIAILQQTKLTDDENRAQDQDAGQTVLQSVVDKATSKSNVEREVRALSTGVDAIDPHAPIRALRKVKHERLQQKLFRLDKDARLRSGARGMAARKALVAFEKVVAESDGLIEQPGDEISSETLQAETQEAVDMLADLQLQIEPTRLLEVESRAKTILTGLGFTEARMDQPIASLSGGWHMRASLAACLLAETDILILDEPTNFLDMLGIIWLQRYIEAMADRPDPPTLILVTHDRDFNNLCTDLLILKDKDISYFHGTLPVYESSQAEKREHLLKMQAAQDKQRAHMEKSIAANKSAGKENNDQNKLRQAKSRQKKLDDRMGLQVSARGGRFKLNRDHVGYQLSARAEIEIPPEARGVTMRLPEPQELRFPGSLISLEKAGYRYKRGAPLTIQDITLAIGMGDRIGILGLNGAGKSTLIKLLVDEAKPTVGSVTTHPRLKMGYYSQHAVEDLQALGRADPTLTALSLLTKEIDGALDEGSTRALLGELGLGGRIASDVPLTKLSGGQLVRCELARLFWKRPHVLVLDEVTTHLDYETVTALREAIHEWEGAVVLVSHDRWFMRGAIEGTMDDEGEGMEDSDDDDDEELARRRAVYRLKGGKMSLLENGVDEFESIVEKRVSKLLAD